MKIKLAGGLGMDYTSVYIAGKKATEGAISVYPYTTLDDEAHPGIKILKKYFTKKGKRQPYMHNDRIEEETSNEYAINTDDNTYIPPAYYKQ